MADNPATDNRITDSAATDLGASVNPAARTANRPARLSVCLITRDEAHHIERCLKSVAFADEWIVLDSGSSDRTVELAQAMGAKVHRSPDWPGFGRQKNRALDLASGDWVFSIDADELVSEELAASIRSVVGGAAATPAAYWVARRSRFCGKLIKHGDWGGDRVLRLFLRQSARFTDDLVHERVNAPEPHGQLAGYLWHDSVETRQDGREKMLRYALLGAHKLRERGKGGTASARLRSLWTFFRGFVLRGGFLDGREGLQIAQLNSRGTYLRYRWAAMTAPQAARQARLEATWLDTGR